MSITFLLGTIFGTILTNIFLCDCTEEEIRWHI